MTRGTVGEMRARVFARDGGCVAPLLDRLAGPCYDRWGRHIPADTLPEMELDYVRLGATHAHHVDDLDHCCVCPGHHRGSGPSSGYQWSTSHRSTMRKYLDSLSDER